MPVPNLRFKDEHGQDYPEWECIEFGEAVKRKSKTEFCKNDLPGVEYEDIISGVGRLNKNIYKKRCEKKGIVFTKGDVLYGKLRPYLKNWLLPDFKGVAIGDFWVLTSLLLKAPFLYYFLQSSAFTKVANTSIGTKMPRADWKLVQAMIVETPSIPEQEKIADFLSTYDRMIDVQSKRLEAMKTRKKGLLQKIFSQEIRFKDDHGQDYPKWKEMKIKDVTLSHNAGIYVPKSKYGTGINIIGVGDIYNSDVINGQQYRLAPVDSDEYLLDEGDLIYGESSLVPEGIARTVCVGKDGKGTAFAWHTRRFKVDKSVINPYFLTLQIDYSERVRNHLMRVCTRTALTGMTTNEYFGTSVSVPSLPEQQKIADFLTAVDTQIDVEEKRLETMKTIKKGLLQQMFI